MTTKIYRPTANGGELQIRSGSTWVPVLGVQSIAVSGGDRETSTFETLDGGVESTFGQAGVKDIAIGLNPSFMGAEYRKLVNDAYYGNSTVRVRYRTLAEKNDIAIGGSGHGVSIPKIGAGLGNESNVTFEGNDGASKVAQDAIAETSELGLLVTGSATAVASGDRTEDEPTAQKFFILRQDGDNIKGSEWAGNELKTALSDSDGWALMRYGIAVEYTCRVVSAMNPDFSVGASIGDTLNLRQVSSGFKIYPITKATS